MTLFWTMLALGETDGEEMRTVEVEEEKTLCDCEKREKRQRGPDSESPANGALDG